MYIIFSDMTKENENQDKKLLDLGCNLVTSLKMTDPTAIKKVSKFFQKQYIDLSYHQDFEYNQYREEWVNNLAYLENFTKAFKGYSKSEIDVALQVAFKVLDKNRQSILQGKEASNG